MSNLYKKIGIVLGVALMMSCSKDMLKEDPSFIPTNPNPGAEGLPPNEQWGWVGKYPGEISNSTQRLQNVEVKLSGAYQSKKLDIAGAPKYWQSTGLYVPPTEMITVNVPSGAEKLHYQIGIADVVIPPGTKYERFDNVCKSGVLEIGENQIYNNFGGPLYFYFEENPSDITVKVSGAVKSLDYTAGVTNLGEWKEAINDTVNPMIWGELIGQRIILTLPVKTLRKIEQPEALLKYYDEIIATDFNAIAGLTDADIQVPFRLYYDIQLPNKALMYPNYPMGFNANTTDSVADAVIDLQNLTHRSCKAVLRGFTGLYREAWNTSTLLQSHLEETAMYHLYQRNNMWNDLGLTTTQPKDPIKRFLMARDDDRKSMVQQLLQRYGWGFYAYSSLRCREEGIPSNVPDRYKNDLYAMYASEYANTDLTAFFAAWNFPVSMYAQQYMKHYPAPTEEFWWVTDVKKQPENTSATPAGTSYEKVIPTRDTIYDRTYWNMTAKDYSESPSRLIDGNMNTIWQNKWSDGNSKFPHWFAANFRDEAGEPIEEEFNYLYFAQRLTHQNPGVHGFVVWVKTTPDPDVDDWFPIENKKTYYLTSDKDASKNNYQYIFLENSYKVYGVKIELISNQPPKEGDPESIFKDTSMAEFGTGLLK